MSSCELKQEIAVLKRKQRDLLIVARNEMVISEMLLSKEPLPKSDELFIKTFLGEKAVIVGTKPDGKNLFSNPYQLAMEIHKANLAGDMDIVQSAAIQLKGAFQSDSELATKMQAVVLNRPDPKYSLVDLSAPSKDILSAVESIQGDSRIAKRKAKAVAAILEINEKLEDKSLSKYDVRFLNEKKLVLQKQGLGTDILDSLNDNVALLRAESLEGNAYNIFPSVMAVHESYANKSEGGTGGKTLEDRLAEEEDGYIAKKISSFSIDGNTVVSLHKNKDGNSVFSHDNGDEISALSMLLGTTSSKSLGATIIDIPNYLKNAIKINSIAHMEDIYKALSYEPGSEEFNRVWDLDMYSDNYDFDMQIISRIHELGGVPQSLILQSLGKSIYKSLPVKFSPEIDKNMEEKAITELGLYALQYMNSVGLTKVEDRFTDKAKTDAARKENPKAPRETTNLFSYNDGNKNQIVIRVNLNQEKNSANFEGLVESSKLVPLISALQYLDVSEDRNLPSSEPITDVQKTIRNSFMDLPKAVHDKILSMQSKPIKFSSDMKAVWQLYKADKNAAYAMAGILEIDTDESIHDQEKELSKINYSKMQFDEMIAAYEEHWDNEFYLPYSYTVSGRYMIDAILNPQESKVTRFLVTSNDMASTISVDEKTGMYNSKDMQKFKLSVAQAFDQDPDKKMDSEAIADLEKIVSISDSGKIEFHNKDKNPFYKALFQMLKLEKIISTHAESENSNFLIDEMIKKELPDFNNIMMAAARAGAGMHTMQALQSIINLQKHTEASIKENGSLSAHVSNITIESDAITSGMILTLLGIGTPDALAMAAKGGVYTKETIAQWENAVKAFNEAAVANGEAPFVVLTNSKTMKFKLTHGWLLSFSKHVEKTVRANENIAKHMADHNTSFADFYNTIGKDANAGLNSIKAELKQDLSELVAKYDEAVDRDADGNYLDFLGKQIKSIEDKIAMSGFVGEITRKLAKPPVMVYIYGAMLSSIKQKMTDAIVLPKIYDVLNAPVFRNASFNYFKGFLNDNDRIAQAVQKELITVDAVKVLRIMFGDMLAQDGDGDTIYDEFGNIEGTDDFIAKRPQFKRFNGVQFVNITDVNDQKLKDLVISPAMAKNLKNASEATLGAAFEEGFKQFKSIDDYRESVKTLEVIRFSMFKYNYQKAIDKVVSSLKQKDGSYAISSGDVAKIVAELEKSGFGHSVNDINGGKQPLYKKEKLMSDIQAVLDLGSYGITSSSVDGKNYSPNTGASGVITVHNIDGFVDSTSSALFNLIRIYDGSVSGINVLEETGDKYNEATAASTDWSSYNTQANLVSKGIRKMMEAGDFDGMIDALADIDKDNLINTLEKLMGYKDIEYINGDDIKAKQAGVSERIEQSIAARFDENGDAVDVDYLHSYVTDLADPVKIKMNDGKENAIASGSIETIYDAYGKIIKSLQKYKRIQKYGDETIDGARKILSVSKYMSNKAYDAALANPKIDNYSLANVKTPSMIQSEYKSFSSANVKPPVYLFADNMERKGSSLSYVGTPNSIGIPIKKASGRKHKFHFSTDEDIAFAIKEIDKAFDRIPKDRNVVVPTNITYTGDNEMEIDQRIKNHIDKRIAELKMTNTKMSGHQHVAPESNAESSNPLTIAGVSASDMSGNAAKDIAMADIATQFIGEKANPNISVSSTEKYKNAFGDKANTGTYTSSDIVMVSGSGPWRGVTAEDISSKFESFYIPLLEKVVAAKSKVVLGSANGIDNLVSKYLKENGYKIVFDKNVGFNKAVFVDKDPKKALDEALDATIPQDKLDQIEDLAKRCKA